MRFHTQTAGVSLTAQQPLNNIVRTTIEALAGVLGGTQSLHTNSYDEALALPTEDAVRIALRTQQIIAEETGVVNTADPLGGSYFVEAITDRMEQQAYAYFRKIDELGGMVEAVKQNYPQREIADASWELQAEIDAGERDRRRRQRLSARGRDAAADPAHRSRARAKQIGRVQAVRARRDAAGGGGGLGRIREAAAGEANLMPLLLDGRGRARHGRRDRRRAPGRLGLVHGDPDLLMLAARTAARGGRAGAPLSTRPGPSAIARKGARA